MCCGFQDSLGSEFCDAIEGTRVDGGVFGDAGIADLLAINCCRAEKKDSPRLDLFDRAREREGNLGIRFKRAVGITDLSFDS